MAQSATNVIAALKRETTFNTAATAGAGGERIRIVDSQGLSMARANIESGERRQDQLRHMGRLGGKDVTGAYSTEVNPGGAFDLLIESLARGTLGAVANEVTISAGTQLAKVSTPASPVYHSYTIEQYDVDIDQSELFTGVRLVGAQFSLQPNQMSTVQWNFQGVDRQVLTTANSPYYTSPNSPSGEPLIADDAVITYGGTPITTLTGMNVNFEVNAALQPVIGSFVSPDVFMNMLTISGDVMAVREDLDALDSFDAETEFEIKVVMSAPGSDPKLTFAFVLPRVKIMSVEAPFSGGDAAKVETRQFWAHPPVGANNAVDFYTSTDTPSAVV